MSTVKTQRGETFAGYNELETDVCCNCGVLFAFPAYMVKKRREDGESFYCPNGHPLHYPQGPSKADKLQRELDAERARAARALAARDQAEAEARAQKGRATRFKNDRDRERRRARAGVCPCCNRTFRQLARHMASQHPDFEEAWQS